MKVGIIATGRMAGIAADTLNKMDDVQCVAAASRNKERALLFAQEHNIERAYGLYEELLDDGEVDLVYVATPHSHHYDITLSAIEHGKPCLVEKAFMANSQQAEAIIGLARQRGVFVAEAMWTRYQPAATIIRQQMEHIGTLRMIHASIGYNMVWRKPKLLQPELCGGALLDVGVYALHFAHMFCDHPVCELNGCCTKSDTGMDLSEVITLNFENGVMATLEASACATLSNYGIISGTEGFIVVDNINNPQTIRRYGADRVLVEEIGVPTQITGYEYEFAACRDALSQHLTESPFMPHRETLFIMKQMDTLRKQWGVIYPMD